MKKLTKAIRLAEKAHRGQFLDGEAPLPYVTHPIAVLNVARYTAGLQDEDLLCVAILHDLLEETDVASGEIEKKFGRKVADLVKQLTRQEPSSAETKGMDDEAIWEMRNGMMLAEIDKMSDEAKIIKLCDRCSNLNAAMKTRSGKKLRRYIRQSSQILEHIDRKVSPPVWDRIKEMIAKASS